MSTSSSESVETFALQVPFEANGTLRAQDPLSQEPLGNEHFELGVGRNLGVSDSFGSFMHPWNLSIREAGAGVVTLQRLQNVNFPYWDRTLFGAGHVPGSLHG